MRALGSRSGRWLGRVALTLGVLAGASSCITAAWAQEHHEGRFERRDERHWRFESRLGWRFEVRPGVWSPYHVWWWVDNRMVLLPAPTVTIVQYPTGYYQLYGNGITTAYYWVWVPAMSPPPPPAPPAPFAGAMPAAPAPPPAPFAAPAGPASPPPPVAAPPAPALPPPAPAAPASPVPPAPPAPPPPR